jgi:GntR family transcriptional regulator
VADLLRPQVLGGTFPAGVLPDERFLAIELACSRNAVREALDLLRGEGLIDRLPGVGTVVTSEKFPHGLNRLAGLAEELREHGEISNEVRAASIVLATGPVAARLGLERGARVVYLERLRRLNGFPLSLDLTYLTLDVGEPLLSLDLAARDVFGLIEQVTGQRLGTADLTIEAVNADAHSAAMLEVPLGSALLMAERCSHLADGRPVDLEFIRFRGDRLRMRVQLPRGEGR